MYRESNGFSLQQEKEPVSVITEAIYGKHSNDPTYKGQIWDDGVVQQVDRLRPDTMIVDGLSPSGRNSYPLPSLYANFVPVRDLQNVTTAPELRIIATDPTINHLDQSVPIEQELLNVLGDESILVTTKGREQLHRELDRYLYLEAPDLDLLSKTGLSLGLLLALNKSSMVNKPQEEAAPSSQKKEGISRRSFLKQAAAATAIGAITSHKAGKYAIKTLGEMPFKEQLQVLNKAIETVTDPLFLEIPHLNIRNTMYGLANIDDLKKNPQSTQRCIVMGDEHQYGTDPLKDAETLKKVFTKYIATVVHNLKIFAKMNPALNITNGEIEETLTGIFGIYDVTRIRQSSEASPLPSLSEGCKLIPGDKEKFLYLSTKDGSVLGDLNEQENYLAIQLIHDICSRDILDLNKELLRTQYMP